MDDGFETKMKVLSLGENKSGKPINNNKEGMFRKSMLHLHPKEEKKNYFACGKNTRQKDFKKQTMKSNTKFPVNTRYNEENDVSDYFEKKEGYEAYFSNKNLKFETAINENKEQKLEETENKMRIRPKSSLGFLKKSNSKLPQTQRKKYDMSFSKGNLISCENK
jgi:hypothetical protein